MKPSFEAPTFTNVLSTSGIFEIICSTCCETRFVFSIDEPGSSSTVTANSPLSATAINSLPINPAGTKAIEATKAAIAPIATFPLFLKLHFKI